MTNITRKNSLSGIPALLLSCASLLSMPALADTTLTLKSVADSFVFTGVGLNATGYYDAASRNFGSMNSRQVAGSGTSRGEFDSVLRFSAASTVNSLNSLYGAGNWRITGISLTLDTSDNVSGPGIFNAPGSSGLFNVSWMSADGGWLQGSGYKNNASGAGSAADHDTTGANFTSGITWNSLYSTLAITPATLLSTCAYVDKGMLVPETFDLGTSSAAFLSALESGSAVSLLLTPADSSVAFNFTSHSYGAGADPYCPTLSLTVAVVPEPAAASLLLLASLCLTVSTRRAPRR